MASFINDKKRKQFNKLNYNITLHIKILGFNSLEKYEYWCFKHGFDIIGNKSKKQLELEIRTAEIEKLSLTLSGKKGATKNFINSIDLIYLNSLKPDLLEDPKLKQISHGLSKCNSKRLKKELKDYLIFISKSSNKLFGDSEMIKAIINLFHYKTYWIRDYQNWKPKSYNREKQFSSLSRHLLALYDDIPSFMDKVWFGDKEIEREWFIHLGKGNNIRTAKKLPVVLTKKMAHHFMNAPSDYTINEALRWGQVCSLRGNKILMEALRLTKLIDDFRDNDFTLSLIRFFVDNQKLDLIHLNPIVDYIWNQKYEGELQFVGPGIAERLRPAQPNFTMKGRTPESLLKQVQSWHNRLSKESKAIFLTWKKSNISNFEYIEGSKEKKNMKLWTIKELLSNLELKTEGRKLKHCVASYVRECFSRKTTIWTLESEIYSFKEKLLTIEVDPHSLTIRQIRGKMNRYPTENELRIIKIWVQNESLILPNKLLYTM